MVLGEELLDIPVWYLWVLPRHIEEDRVSFLVLIFGFMTGFRA